MSRHKAARDRIGATVISVLAAVMVVAGALAVADDRTAPHLVSGPEPDDRAAVGPRTGEAPSVASAPATAPPLTDRQRSAVLSYVQRYNGRIRADAERGDGSYDATAALMTRFQHPDLSRYTADDCADALGRGGPGYFSYIEPGQDEARPMADYTIGRGRQAGLEPSGRVYTLAVDVRSGNGEQSTVETRALPFAFIHGRGPYFFNLCE